MIINVRLNKLFSKYGQDITLVRSSEGAICPGYEPSNGYCDPQYHRNHPEVPQCDKDGHINAVEQRLDYKAFVQPLSAYAKLDPELYRTLIGKVKADTYVYLGPAEHDIRNLKESEYGIYDGRAYRFTNPDEYMIGNQIAFFFATLELIEDA